ncbi:hypothetical protein FNF27_00754 [Cafeteria roenbergensis]|uniref:Riboflavin synthase n=1 Tax=Cafeteria roenbergensis TaxID=33653 RepID=A0A5A8CT16_CAFRO|nr:hypothetical protein FNF28_07426 [Cafeteria roenbergensis]KAA0156213.1 hypothetical protein FNF29_01003 [Cafeteria roenbergensis]KAA0160947.1 hypothetical protein FNF31_04019 [Cafeteria roenbergensis]KAA0177584.1 hypothetical protein FNF27_00754 [Cafeteria roenbergensis]|eukprot:KAA0156213.1 hypothetical protein FNF29_01003 [Cafeteria roenbergensis]
MFTGIVEEIGKVLSFEKRSDVLLWDESRGEGYVLVIECATALEDAYIGCSIAVNGVCLTVTHMDAKSFTAHIAPETLRRSNLGDLRAGSAVDLERSASASARVSGHMVQGHVDCAAAVVSKRADGADCLSVQVELPAEHADLMRFIVEKGYVAVDGASLTVTAVDVARRRFSFMLIPHTQLAVVIPKRAVGDRVNVEVDCLAKYAAQSGGAGAAAAEEAAAAAERRAARAETLAGAAVAVAAAAACVALWAASRVGARQQ